MRITIITITIRNSLDLAYQKIGSDSITINKFLQGEKILGTRQFFNLVEKDKEPTARSKGRQIQARNKYK